MELHQLQVSYQQEEDRLLLRVSFTGGDQPLHEVRAWITRRLLRNLWPGLGRALETQVTLNKPQAAHAKAEIVSMEHQAAITDSTDRGEFSAPFKAEAQAFPIGEAPILITAVHFNLAANKPLKINFTPAKGHGFEIGLPTDVLHSFCNLLREAVKVSQWDIQLQLPGVDNQAGKPRVLN
jgi:hypothetical protein